MRGKKAVVPVSEILRAEAARRDPGGQVSLAREIGTSEGTVSRWVNGKDIPDEKWAPAIARATRNKEETVLAAISLARKMRHEARQIELQQRSESDEFRVMRETLAALTAKVEELERRLGEQNRRRPR